MQELILKPGEAQFIVNARFQKAFFISEEDNNMPLEFQDLYLPKGKYFWGYASFETVDLQGDIFPLETLKGLANGLTKAPYNKVFVNHDYSDIAVGTIVATAIDENGLLILGKLNESHSRAEEVWGSILDGSLDGFSMGGSFTKTDSYYDADLDMVVTVAKEAIATEVSLTSIPVNGMSQMKGAFQKSRNILKEKGIEPVMETFSKSLDDAPEEFLKAHYIRRTGSPGNYKYEYNEPAKTGHKSDVPSLAEKYNIDPEKKYTGQDILNKVGMETVEKMNVSPNTVMSGHEFATKLHAVKRVDTIMEISNALLKKHKKNTGRAIEEPKIKEEFLSQVKEQVGSVSQEDLAKLEDENYHTEISVLMDAGLVEKKKAPKKDEDFEYDKQELKQQEKEVEEQVNKANDNAVEEALDGKDKKQIESILKKQFDLLTDDEIKKIAREAHREGQKAMKDADKQMSEKSDAKKKDAVQDANHDGGKAKKELKERKKKDPKDYTSFIDVLNDPEGKSMIENIEDIDSSLDNYEGGHEKVLDEMRERAMKELEKKFPKMNFSAYKKSEMYLKNEEFNKSMEMNEEQKKVYDSAKKNGKSDEEAMEMAKACGKKEIKKSEENPETTATESAAIETPAETPVQTETHETPQVPQETSAPQETKEAEVAPEPEVEPAPEVDYKAEYEKSLKLIEEQKTQLSEKDKQLEEFKKALPNEKPFRKSQIADKEAFTSNSAAKSKTPILDQLMK